MAQREKKNREKKAKRPIIPFVERGFEGLPTEAELVAMREILPLATLPVRTSEEYGSQELLLATILPSMAAAMRREDGTLLVAIQTVTRSSDASLDIATNILNALELEAGEYLTNTELPEPGPRLNDVLDMEGFGELTLYREPSFWMSEEEAAKPENVEALRQARESVIPTEEVEGIPGAYWCRMSREFLRWVRPEPRDQVLDALARLRASGTQNFEGARFVGAFRAQGMSIPVWELERGTEADELPSVLASFQLQFEAALASTEPLSMDEKRARAGIVSRQVTLR